MEQDLLQYIDASLLVLVAVVYCLGIFLKKIPGIKDWLIPIILLVSAILITVAYMAFIQGLGMSVNVALNGFIQGILVASVAVYGNQVLKQIGKAGE